MKNKHSILSKPPRPRLKPDGNRKLPSKQQMYITWNPLLIVLILFLVKTALRVLNVRPTYLTIFDWFRSVRIPFRTLLRTLLPSLVILLVTAHSDRQMSHRKFRIGRYTRANKNYSRNKSSPQSDSQTIRKKIGSHTFSQTETTHQNGALKIPGMPIDTVHKGSWGLCRRVSQVQCSP